MTSAPRSTAPAGGTADVRAPASRPLRLLGPHQYATTHRLTELLDEAGRVWILKEFGPDADSVSPQPVGVAPSFVTDPQREVRVYRDLMPAAGLVTLNCLKAHDEPGTEHIVLERVDGPVLWQVGELGIWRDVAIWVAGMHDALAPLAADPPAPLLHYDRDYYLTWADRAEAFASAQDRLRVEAVTSTYRSVVDDLLTLDREVIHGELYASNVLVVQGDPTRVVPIDWEMAAVGPAAVDLAALITGWDEETQGRLVAAYAQARGLDQASVWREVLLGGLHLGVRWLGWARDWEPPGEHRRDWLADAEDLVARLGR